MIGSDGDEHEGKPLADAVDNAVDSAGESTANLASGLQDKLAAHGRRLAEAASERVSGLADDAAETISGKLGEFGAAGAAASAGVGAALTGAAAKAGETVTSYADDTVDHLAGAEPLPLDLEEPARLPWLESADDDDEEDGVDTRRVAIFVAVGLALLAAIVGGIWWATHRGDDTARVADGSVIEAPAEPYKTAPENPGGKTYDGTGDSSFAVSQGHNPPALLGNGGTAASATATGAVKTAEQAGAVAMAAAKAAGGAAASGAAAAGHAAAVTHDAAASAVGGVGVQVGAYTSQASAEAGWAKIQKQYAPLSGMRHRIVQGQADIGTVYRVQAVTDSEGAASALCSGMKSQGLACQVRK